jgi:hypothetical protein
MINSVYIQKLEQVILNLHGAKATHRESVPVKEMYQGEVAWDGVVDVFDLVDHPKAKIAYAWSHESDAGGKRYVAVLGVGPVDSPLRAVQAAIAHEAGERT